MDETELIISLQNHLDSTVSAPIRTSGVEDERPVPGVIIEDWNTEDLNFHNSAFAGEASGDFNNDGSQEYERYLNFDWETRVEFLVRHDDEVDVSRLKESVKLQLRLMAENPQGFDSALKEVTLGVDGNPTYTFTEPKEAELMASATFHGDHTITRKPSDMQYDTLEQVKDTFTFEP